MSGIERRLESRTVVDTMTKTISQNSAHSAVVIRNACLSFTPGIPVVANLNMTVPHESIYGLIGASGCGKTTILSCIVGLTELDCGEILVYGNKSGTSKSKMHSEKVGYMPQELGLYEYLTVNETLQFFGKVYGMNNRELQTSSKFLLDLLQLPSTNRKLGDLSCGQKRLTSLATSLIHSPRLLVLDEPTVGLDPLLRERIWDHFRYLVQARRTTIIMSTHYIEEARHTDTIGYMRHGRLLEEKPPDQLLQEHQVSFLKDVIIKLCHLDEVSRQANKLMSSSSRGNNTSSKYGKSTGPAVNVVNVHHAGEDAEATQVENGQIYTESENGKCLQLSRRVVSLATKNYRNLLRTPIFLLGLSILPAVHLVLTSLSIGKEPHQFALGVINKEHIDWYKECNETDRVCGNSLSCAFIESLRKTEAGFFDIVPLKSEREAEEKVRKGELWGYFSIPKNYTQSVVLRKLLGNFADDKTVEGTIIKLRLDMSQYLASLFIINHAYGSFRNFVGESIELCGGNKMETELPFNLSTPVYGTTNSNYLEYIIPGILVLSIFLIILSFTAVCMITERKQGTLDRSRVAGANTIDTILARFITDGTIIIFQAGVGSGILIIGFNLKVNGSITLFLLISILSGVLGHASGFLVGILCRDEIEALFWAMFICLPMFLLSGVFWPLQAMSNVLRWFAYALPLTLTCESMRSITNRGVGISHPTVWPGIVILCGWTLLFSVINWKLFPVTKMRATS